MYSASVTVYDQDGQPLASVPVRLEVHTTTMFDFDIGTTDSNGYVYLVLTADGFLDYMYVTITNQNYEILSSQGTYTETSNYLYPTFNVGLDMNRNDVVDAWEMPLAQKFCPVLFAAIEDRGLPFGGGLTTLRPVPVEIMDRDGPGGQPDGILDYHDVEVSVYNVGGQLVGIYDMEDLTVLGTAYSNRYPDIILPYEQRSTQPPGKAYASYILVPQYEWASTNVPEDNVAWYAHWEERMSEHSGDTWYEDGTTYVAFDKSGGNTRVNYLFHYPFNASAGRHEGDLPTIRVTINSQNPNTASIISVSYPIHGIGSVRTIKVDYNQSLAESFAGQTFNDDGNVNPAFANKYFAIAQTHPVSFVGGYLEKDGVWGFGSHAQYPCPGKWHRNISGVTLDEFVVAGGLISIETVQFDFNVYQNIKLIPPRQYIIDHLRQVTAYNWLVFGGNWGHWNSLPTAGADNPILTLIDFVTEVINLLPFVPNLEIPLENIAPLSPYRGSLQP